MLVSITSKGVCAQIPSQGRLVICVNMLPRLVTLLATCFFNNGCFAVPNSEDVPRVRPYTVNLSEGVPHMLDLIRSTVLPDEPQYPGVGSSMGIDLDELKSLRDIWLRDFDWNREQASINRYAIFPT